MCVYKHRFVGGRAVASGTNGCGWRMTLAGVTTEFDLAPNSEPSGICAGPDSNLWFLEAKADKVGMIVP
jgi:streptogramin lyase